jgi:hypothetical protein
VGNLNGMKNIPTLGWALPVESPTANEDPWWQFERDSREVINPVILRGDGTQTIIIVVGNATMVAAYSECYHLPPRLLTSFWSNYSYW